MNTTNETVMALVARLNANLREAWEERAAIRQFEGGLTKDHAECLALLDVIDMYPKESIKCLTS